MSGKGNTSKRRHLKVGAKSAHPNAISEALRNFDLLPNSAYVRQPVVQALFAISGSTVWRWCHIGGLPKPQKLSGNVTGWNVGGLRDTQAKLKRVTP